MKYIKPTDFVSVREFQAKYKRIEDDITELLTTDGSARTADELNKKLNTALNAAVSYLSSVNAKYAKDELSRAFDEGKGQTNEPPKRTVAEVNEILSAQGFRYAKNAFSQNTYIELQQSMQAARKDLTQRVNGIIKRLEKTVDDSIYNVQQAIVADLQQNGVLTVEYKNGAKQPISSYAAMAARSARIETTNIASIGRALQAGTDLVKMTTMPQCCKLCGAYQDKVYSISGKDKRFPALFKTVLSRGYALPHPNCRHEFIPYFAEIEDPADVERMIKQSQIKYDSNGGLVDVRWQKDIEAYAQWQAGNRQRNAELHEYERMREYYASNGIDAPYSTLGAFRRARRAGGEAYKASRKEWQPIVLADSGKIKVVPLKKDAIKGMKYEKKFAEFLPASIAHTVAVKAREILRENNRERAETVYLMSIKDGAVIYKHHEASVEFSIDVGKINNLPDDSLVLIHNHPSGNSFSIFDLEMFIYNNKIHTMIAVAPNGKVYALRIKKRNEKVDIKAIGMYNRGISEKMPLSEILESIALELDWEYEEL